MSPAEFRDALERGDVKALRHVWAKAYPQWPQEMTDAQVEAFMHKVRTEAESITLKARAYSHRWLTERDLPSGLPDELKPKAARLYPRIVSGVGVSVNFRSEYLRPAATEIRNAIEAAVEDAYAEKRTDPAFVTARMNEARGRAMKALFGNTPGHGR